MVWGTWRIVQSFTLASKFPRSQFYWVSMVVFLNPGPGKTPSLHVFDISLIRHMHLRFTNELMSWIRYVWLGRHLRCALLRVLQDQDWETLIYGMCRTSKTDTWRKIENYQSKIGQRDKISSMMRMLHCNLSDNRSFLVFMRGTHSYSVFSWDNEVPLRAELILSPERTSTTLFEERAR